MRNKQNRQKMCSFSFSRSVINNKIIFQCPKVLTLGGEDGKMMNGLYLKSAFLVQSSDHSRYFCTPYHIHPFIHANACSSHARTDGVKFRSNLKFSVSLNDTRGRVIEPQIIWLVSNPLYLLSHSLRDCSAVRHVKQLRCTDLPLNWNAIQYKSKSQYITKCTQWNNNSTHTHVYIMWDTR